MLTTEVAKVMSTHHKKYWVAAGVLCVVVLAFASSGAIAKQLDSWDLLPKPEPYTTLSFNDYQKLPTKAKPGEDQHVTATVRNIQHQETTYRYTLSVVPMGGEEQVVKQGECTIAHEATCQIDEHFTVPKLPTPRMQVKLTLNYHGRSYDQPAATDQTQTLHYWIELTPPARSTP